MVSLFATLDRKLRFTLSRPGILVSLNAVPLSKYTGKQFWHLLASLRTVESLQLELNCLQTSAHLATLNPRHLDLRGPDVPTIASRSLGPHYQPDVYEAYIQRYWDCPDGGRNCLPNFSLLAPRLVTLDLSKLEFRSARCASWKLNATFLPTLVSFACLNNVSQECIMMLPEGLSSLTTSTTHTAMTASMDCISSSSSVSLRRWSDFVWNQQPWSPSTVLPLHCRNLRFFQA